ncbi:DUF3866 family protein [Arcanobacterium hippocoleae]|uniref:DUF3866 family protein n=1 Tax=Arcanobacterium hippocoleae TaxID=149017 RepID=A0ABU1T066_9ACTO|nr:DUF3866 family protein [Arcanobacterium hippocoleae]MDR6938769.1 hypothetical protein [Arcanobacterium hippocoleae]
MMIWRRGKVISLGRSWSEAVELQVQLLDTDASELDSTKQLQTHQALAYRPITGEVHIGDIVLLSTAAVQKGLGTGGYLFVVANTSCLPADPPPQPGHLMKARYTPTQFMVQGVDEQESDYHHLLADADDIKQMPVICADLHSALPAIVLGIQSVSPRKRIAYVMTDGGALPAWFSQVAAQLEADGAILGTITAGQAFGGKLEAVNIYTALLAAKHVWNADITVVAQGPGNLGTGTKWGFSGTQIGEALNAAGILNGRPIAALRLSNADKRGRHYGISHHSLRILKDLVNVECSIIVPALHELAQAQDSAGNFLLHSDFLAKLKKNLAQLTQYKQLQLKSVDIAQLIPILENSPYSLRTMGRSFSQDASGFIAAAAAGKFAAEISG